MVGMKRKLNVEIEEKMKILTFLRENLLKKKNKVVSKFNVLASTLSIIIKSRETFLKKFESNRKDKKSVESVFFPKYLNAS